MAVNPMLASGANGILQGLKGFERTAQDVAELNVQDTGSRNTGSAEAPTTKPDNLADVAEAMVDLKLYQRQVQASAKVVQTADEVIGFLLDVRA